MRIIFTWAIYNFDIVQAIQLLLTQSPNRTLRGCQQSKLLDTYYLTYSYDAGSSSLFTVPLIVR